MNTAQLNRFRQRLKDLAVRMHHDVVTVSEQAFAASGGQAMGELSNAPTHLGDMGTDEYLHDLNATLLENEQYLSREAAAALTRIDEGTFGRCESCQREIPRERLEAVPYARHCTRCAAAMQETPAVNFNAGRPHSPADTFAPEGEMGDNQRPTVQGPPSDQTPGPPIAPQDTDIEASDFE
jgi:DnaK suppressor protein